MSGWGTGWEAPIGKQIDAEQKADTYKHPIALLIEETGKVLIEAIPKIYDTPKFLNKKPTHDPYTNPNAHIYYQCGCGAVLDPGTKSFAELNNCASKADWKIRWGADSYVPYCVKCGEDVE